MKHACNLQLNEQMNESTSQKLPEQFHIFSSGLVFSIPSQRIYYFDELVKVESEKPCPICGKRFLYVTEDGTAGIINEHWWSETQA